MKRRGSHLTGRAEFREGSLAFFNGQDVAANPYAASQSDDAEAWIAGWTQARQLRHKVLSEHLGTGTAGNFCCQCLRTTGDQSAGNTYVINGIGTMLYGRKHRCNVCGSVVAVKWVTFFYNPVFPLGRYRVLWQTNDRFLSRWIPPYIEQ